MGYSVTMRRVACPGCAVVQELEEVRHSLGGLVEVEQRECPVCGTEVGGDG